MILRIDRLQTQLPPPSVPDPQGAAMVQELLGGKFGELSTWLNYSFQSFNFRSRQGARPFLPKQPTGNVSDESVNLVGTLKQSAKRTSSRANKAKTKSGAPTRSKK